MRKERLQLEYVHYSLGSELNEVQKQLLLEAQEASSSAYAPYSGFNVGASLLLEDGRILKGCNQENASYPSGICAERSVIASFGNMSPKIKVLKMAISSNSKTSDILPATPCGFCRQVMAEFELQNKQEIELIIGNLNGVTLFFNSLTILLPLAFSKDHMKNL
jgi:cytidine deaminase